MDDELDENDFNFDNENEDDLLAENEYDDFIDKSEVISHSFSSSNFWFGEKVGWINE